MLIPLVYPMAAHVGLAALLYAALTVARAPDVWGLGRHRDGTNPWASVEPRISANLSNQFELPLFFHVACLLLIQLHASGPVPLALAWLFVGGRLVHTFVQVVMANIRVRGLVFTISFGSVLGLWLCLLANALGPAA